MAQVAVSPPPLPTLPTPIPPAARAAAPAHAPQAEPEAVAPPVVSPKERLGETLSRYAVVYTVTRPHGRIGVAWALTAAAAAVKGKAWLAAWLGVTAFVGASQAAAARRALEQRPPPWLAALVAVGLPAAAVFGGGQLAIATAGTALVAAAIWKLLPGSGTARDLARALLIGLLNGLAAGSVVATRALGADVALYLLACAGVYDAGAYVVGTGAAAVWEGPVAGMVALLPVAVLADVLLVPPLPAGGPVALGILAALLAPLGPLVASAVLGRRDLDAPGLRRLDSLLLLAPMWAWAAGRFLG